MQKTPANATRFPHLPHGPPLPGWIRVALVANDRIRSFSTGWCTLPRRPVDPG